MTLVVLMVVVSVDPSLIEVDDGVIMKVFVFPMDSILLILEINALANPLSVLPHSPAA